MYKFDLKYVLNSSVAKIQKEREKILNALYSHISEEDKKNDSGLSTSTLNSLTSDSAFAQLIYYYLKNGLNVAIDFSKIKNNGISKKDIDNLIEKAHALNLPLNIYIQGYSKFGKEKEHIQMLFDENAMNNLISLNDYLKAQNQNELRFLEDSFLPQESWTLSQVLNANREIDSVVESIKRLNFSPFETMAYIHHYITNQFAYNDDKNNPFNSRSIVGLYNTDKIVCVGYAQLAKAIVDKLNMPGLEISTMESVITSTKKSSKSEASLGFMHVQDVVKIDDPKYNIKGTYINDSCWDSKDEDFTDGKGFGNFMIPIEDLFHMQDQKFIQTKQLSDEQVLKVMYNGAEIPPAKMPIYKQIKNSKPIPFSAYDLCISKMLRKVYPELPEIEIDVLSNKYLMHSTQVASSIYDKNSKGKIAQLGWEVLKKLGKTESDLDSSQFVR